MSLHRRSSAAFRHSLTGVPVSALSCRRGVAQRIYSRRHHSSTPSSIPNLGASNLEALDQWIAFEKRLDFTDTLRPEHLADLYITLPTRDGSKQQPYDPPQAGAPLGYGHHLVFFHPRNPESALRSDGTDVSFCPPEPFTRRMWAGGRMVWKRPLYVGDMAAAVSTIHAVEKKGIETGTPMVFVKQRIEYSAAGIKEVCIEEERSHVYLATAGNRRGAKTGEASFKGSKSVRATEFHQCSEGPATAGLHVRVFPYRDDAVPLLRTDLQWTLYSP